MADITSRAGVSRSTFFNYVDSKSDLLWARFDDGLANLRAQLAADRAQAAAERAERASLAASDPARVAEQEEPGAGGMAARSQALTALRTLAANLPAENVALAYLQAGPMGLGADLRVAEARRLVELRDALAVHLVAGNADPLAAQVVATHLAGALLAAVRHWSMAGVGRPPLTQVLERALTMA